MTFNFSFSALNVQSPTSSDNAQFLLRIMTATQVRGGDGIPSLAMPSQIVVAAAVISGPTVLVAQRVRPPELAGRWELPGGKVAPGETESDALARELAEELGLRRGDVEVGDRLGADIALNETTTLRAYRVRLLGGEPHPRDHQALRWVTAAELDDVDWVPADRGWLEDLARAL
jgi:8-oxo-dGTP diphosphatase